MRIYECNENQYRKRTYIAESLVYEVTELIIEMNKIITLKFGIYADVWK